MCPLLTGCFELVEEIDLNEDGSGDFQMILNLSRSKSKVDALLLLDEIHGYKVPSLDKIERELAELRDSIENEPGISGTQFKFDKVNYIIEFSCHFDKVERLNGCVYNIWNRLNNSGAKKEIYYQFQGKTFYRNAGAIVSLLYQKMKPSDYEVLQDALYISVYRFPHEVSSQTNSLAKISGTKKIVFLRSPMQQLLLNPKLFRNTIKLKP